METKDVPAPTEHLTDENETDAAPITETETDPEAAELQRIVADIEGISDVRMRVRVPAEEIIPLVTTAERPKSRRLNDATFPREAESEIHNDFSADVFSPKAIDILAAPASPPKLAPVIGMNKAPVEAVLLGEPLREGELPSKVTLSTAESHNVAIDMAAARNWR